MESLGLVSPLCAVCTGLGVKKPTPIQQNAIPWVLKNRDLVGVAPTGTGKTLAYVLPLLQRLSRDPFSVFALCLLPTKELALQVIDQFLAYAAPAFNFKENRIRLIVGGDGILAQTRALAEKPYVVVATPGRFLSLLKIGDQAQAFQNVQVVVLDEADRLLSGTLLYEVHEIWELMRPSTDAANLRRQHLLFTATDSINLQIFRHYLSRLARARIEQLSREVLAFPLEALEKGESASFNRDEAQLSSACVYINAYAQGSEINAVHASVTACPKTLLPTRLQHFYLLVPCQVKPVYLTYLLTSTFEDQSIMVFTKTCQTAQILTTFLERFKLSVTTLHSLLGHKRRVAHLHKFRSHLCKVLVTTDVGSRGLDIPQVEVILHYDFPTRPEDYVHRCGRTARVGREGTSVAFVCEKDKVQHVHDVEAMLEAKLEGYKGFDEEKALKKMPSVVRKYQETRQILHEGGFFERAHAAKSKKLRLLKKRSRKGAFG